MHVDHLHPTEATCREVNRERHTVRLHLAISERILSSHPLDAVFSPSCRKISSISPTTRSQPSHAKVCKTQRKACEKIAGGRRSKRARDKVHDL
eukprot:765143-Hanusia_phi.AAC.3